MARGYRLDAESIRRVSQVVQQSESATRNTIGPSRSRVPSDIRWFAAKNVSGTDIPGHAVAAITGMDLVSSEIPLPRIDKPSTTFYRQYVVVNPGGIKSGESGLVTIDGPVTVAYDSGTPAVGEGWGPKPGQWTLTKNYPQTALVIGLTDTTNKRMLAQWGMIDFVLGKTDAAISKGSSGTVSAWGSSDTTVNITGVVNQFADIASGKFVGVRWINGIPYLVAAECG